MARWDRLSRVLLLALVAGAWGGGCAPVPREVQLARGFASPGTPYGELLPRYTRAAELYDGLQTVAKAWATWRAPELRSALAEASVTAFRLEGETAKALRLEEERAGRRVREFHLALYTPKPDWNDLESPDTLWRAYLYLPDGQRLEPVRVIHLPKTDKSPVEYPYVTRWTREYSLFFANLEGREGADAPPVLVLAGPLGALRLAY